MAVESSSECAQVSDSSRTKISPAQEQENGLLPGERVVSALDSRNEGSFRLTHARVIFNGSSDSNAIYASAQLKDITAIKVSRRPRARRSAAWGIVGLFSAIGVWQITPDSTVGLVSSVAVAAISLLLMADYWIRPAGVHVELQTMGGNIIGAEVGENSSLVMQFVQDVEDAKRRLISGRVGAPYRNYPSS